MLDNYKNLILIGIAFLVGIFFTLIVINPSFQNREVAERSLPNPVPPPPQFTDSNLMKVLPVEELGVDTYDPQSLASLGDQYFESSNYKQAIELYKKALEINPNDTDTFNDLGLAYQYTGNSDLLLDMFSSLRERTKRPGRYCRKQWTWDLIMKSDRKL
jgi:tetratricopeptide (TPR) repeat protein